MIVAMRSSGYLVEVVPAGQHDSGLGGDQDPAEAARLEGATQQLYHWAGYNIH